MDRYSFLLKNSLIFNTVILSDIPLFSSILCASPFLIKKPSPVQAGCISYVMEDEVPAVYSIAMSFHVINNS